MTDDRFDVYTPIDSELVMRATSSLNEEIQKELDTPDPTPERAKALLERKTDDTE